MEHINTLKHFDNLVASGVPAQQARAHVESLNSSFDSVVTTKDLKIMENDLKIFFTVEIILVAATLLAIPMLAKRLGWS